MVYVWGIDHGEPRARLSPKSDHICGEKRPSNDIELHSKTVYIAVLFLQISMCVIRLAHAERGNSKLTYHGAFRGS